MFGATYLYPGLREPRPSFELLRSVELRALRELNGVQASEIDDLLQELELADTEIARLKIAAGETVLEEPT